MKKSARRPAPRMRARTQKKRKTTRRHESEGPPGPVMIVTGETSGDLLGGDLAVSLGKLGFRDLLGTGGKSMGQAGVELIETIEAMEVLGWVLAVIASIPLLIGQKTFQPADGLLAPNGSGLPLVIGGIVLIVGIVLVILGKSRSHGVENPVRDHKAEA